MAEIYTVNVDTKAAVKSIAALEKELAEATEQMKQVEVGSKAFNELQKKAAAAKQQIDRVNQATDALSKGFQGWGENLTKVASGISGGITAATAAMQMMGVENENVLAGIAKLQQLMAFTQGISAMKDMAAGMRALAVATKAAAGPLGILAGIVTGLVLVWTKWGDKLRQDYPIIDKVATAIENLKNKLMGVDEAVNKAVEGGDKLAEIEKKLADIDTSKRVARLNEEAKTTYNLLQAEKQRLELEIQRAGLLMKNSQSEEEFNEHKAKWLEYDAQRLAIEKQINDLFESRASYAQAVEGVDIDFLNQARGAGMEAPQAPQFEREEEEESDWGDKVKEAQDYYNSLMELQYSEFAAFQANQQAKLAALKQALDEGLIAETQYSAAVKKLAKEEKQYKVQMSMSAASGVADILNNLAATMDETNEKQFKAMKAMQISAATIQMMVGITTALSGAFTTKTGPWDIALAVIQAAAIAASGAAQIASISRQKYNSESGGSTSTSLSSAAITSTLTQPEQYTQAVDSANIEESIKDSRVYVVESDIADTSRRVNVQESENRY